MRRRFRHTGAVKTVVLVWLAALCVPALRAGPDSSTLSQFIDRNRSSVFGNTEGAVESLDRMNGAPAPQKKLVEVPPDISDASRRWGIQAQIQRLQGDDASPKAHFSIAIIGDGEPGRYPWEKLFPPADKQAFEHQMAIIQGMKPDFVLQLGDFVSIGDAGDYEKFLRFLDVSVHVPMFPVIGNHDRSRPNGSSDDALYGALFKDTNYFFDYNGWRIVALDTSQRSLGLSLEQLTWLDDALNTPLHKIVMTHVPPAYLKWKLRPYDFVGKPYTPPVEKEGPLPEGYLKDFLTNFFMEGSDKFQEIVSRHHVDRVYMGHIHRYGLAEINGVRYVLSGGGGSPLYLPLPPGFPERRIVNFIWVELGPDGLKETLYEYGGLKDNGEINPPIAHPIPETPPEELQLPPDSK